MLESMRKAAGSWVAKGLMGLLVVSFAIWGIGDVVRGYGTHTLVQVGSATITPEQFREEYDRALSLLSRRAGQMISRDQARAMGLDRQVLKRMIDDAALSERARQLGLNVTDATVAREITENPAFRGPSGRFDRAYFNEVLRDNGLSERGFVALERSNQLRRQLAEAVAGGATAPDPLVEAVHRFRAEKRSIEYVDVTSAAAGDVAAPDEAALQSYYEANKQAFRAPEYRRITLLKLEPEELAARIQVSDADAKALYESRKDRFVEPERRQVLQLAFPSKEAAEAAAQKIKSGESFEQAVEAQGRKPADIDLGLKSKAELLDPAVADAAFALPANGVSEPVQTRFGSWVLVKVADIKPGAAKSFEDVKDEIRQELARERAGKELLETHDKVEDTLASGATLEETAQKLGLEARTVEMDRQGRAPSGEPVPDLPAEPELLPKAFAAGTGTQNDPIQIDRGRAYLWYEVTGVTPARDRGFDEARQAVAARWHEEQLRDRIKALADRIAEAVKSGRTLEAAAAEHGLTALRADAFTRNDTPSMLTRAGIQAVFATPEGGVGQAPGTTAPDRVVFRVASVEVPPLDPNAPDLEPVRRQIASDIGGDFLASYVTQIRDAIGVTINDKALPAALGDSTR